MGKKDVPLLMQRSIAGATAPLAAQKARRQAPGGPKIADMQFIESLSLLMLDICARLPELSHVRLPQIQLVASSCRSRRNSGVLAYVLPLKFSGGRPVEIIVRGNRTYHYAIIPTFLPGGAELLYSVHFLMPRFLNLSPEEKIATIIHELYHIHPDFNGDLRRFPGGRLHGPTQRQYHEKVAGLTQRYRKAAPSILNLELLRLGHRQFEKRFGPIRVAGRPKGSRPKLLKVEPIPPSEFTT